MTAAASTASALAAGLRGETPPDAAAGEEEGTGEEDKAVVVALLDELPLRSYSGLSLKGKR